MAERWKQVLPHWKHHLWDDAENRQLWEQHHRELLPTYDAYERSVERADVSRLLYLYHFGGIYSDLDVAPCNDPLQNVGDAQLLIVRDATRRKEVDQQILSNFFMGSVRGHPFWLHAISRLAAAARHPRNTIYRTGPGFLHEAYQSFLELHSNCTALIRGMVVLSHNEWQRRGVGAHHWLSTWQLVMLKSAAVVPKLAA